MSDKREVPRDQRLIRPFSSLVLGETWKSVLLRARSLLHRT